MAFDFRIASLALIGGTLATISPAQPATLVSGDRVVEIRGSASNDRFGRPLLFADLDNDGFDDLVVGSDRSDFSGGQRRTVYLFKGGSSFMTRGLIDLAVDSPDGIILAETGSTTLATALTSGDLNNDGIADLVLSDSLLTVSGRASAGAVYIVFGGGNFFSTATRDFATGAWDVKILGAAAGDNTAGSTIFGGGISDALACGDIDNDGIDDLAMGAHLSDSGGPADSGAVRIVKGRSPFASGTIIDLATQANYRIYGDDTDDQLGMAVTIGDINNDGIKDLAIGVSFASVGTFTDEGYVYVFFGRTTFPATTNLGSASASFQIIGGEANADFGDAVAIGDVNNDNLGDLIVASPGWDGAGNNSNDFGAIFGFFGRSTWTTSFTSTGRSFQVSGYSNAANIGRTLGVGDVNGDGIDDMVFASRDTARSGFSAEGRTFIKYGAASLTGSYALQTEQVDLIINGDVNGLQLGDALAVGDPDGDGAAEIVLAAPFVSSTTGRVYLFDPSGVMLKASDAWTLY